ncbi:MAG TPA: ABC transporter permease subunit [Dehalococcoidia bacterium]|nr:ABC transporter permease subunit [Dehalococcoidia bacterium]
MAGVMSVFRKELADHFSGRRFVILFALICVAGLSATWVAGQSIRADVSGDRESGFVFLKLFTASSGVLPPFVSFIGFLGPLIGLALGFDAINSEHARGTLSRVLSQPIYRDSVINGKFLAGIATIGLMLLSIGLLLGGMGLRMIGVPPTLEEVLRLASFLVLSMVYVAFWMSLSVLFSVVFRQTATSALAGMAVWIFATFFLPMLAGIAADSLVPVGQDSEAQVLLLHENVSQMLSRLSPATLYQEATLTVLTPQIRTLGPILLEQTRGMLPNPLSWSQSLLIAWPHVVGLLALTLICFAISYVRFMRQEIRAT